MNLTSRIAISVVIAAAASVIVTYLTQSGAFFNPIIAIGFLIATIGSSLLGHSAGDYHEEDFHDDEEDGHDSAPKQRADKKSDLGKGREFGKVKWFNVSKGFGFIVRDNGEEVFVHFRSIQGKGRRGLRDGQRVSYVIVQSDKGPQAEEVSPED